MPEKLVKTVKFICPVCKYKIFIYLDELQEKYAFDGKDFSKLPKIDCHICHRSQAQAQEIQEVPDSWADPLDIWQDQD